MDYVKKFLNVEGVIGQGAFGRVLITTPLEAEIRFALKCVHPILRPQRLANELRHLRDLGGQCNVVQMHTAHFYKGSLYIVMELIEHDRFVDIVDQLDYSEIVIYMKNLLIALEHVHKHSIMHRDIKPANFLFNRKNKKFLLVDFGLAQTVRTRSTLFGNRTNLTATTPTSHHKNASNQNYSISLAGSPGTPTTPTSRRLMAPLFPDLGTDSRSGKDKFNDHHNQLIKPTIPFLNLKSTHILHQSPARHYINLTPNGSPNTPNMSTKRQLLPDAPNSNDFNQMLKKLRVSNNNDNGIAESKEPVRLTVGAYESPVTHNDNHCTKRNQQNHKFSTPTIPSRRAPGAKCDCRGKPKTCTTCLSRPDSNASKSGTPGYKAPEILLRHQGQTMAVDIWSAGIIMACLLSGHSPFLRDVDDTVSLAEIITIFGSQRVTQAAKALGIRLNVEPKREPVDLAQLCRTIRTNNIDKRQIDLPDTAFELLNRMLDPNPLTRITASEALKHPWFNPETEV